MDTWFIWTISKHRKTVLKLSVPDKKREWIAGLFKNVTDFSPPITFSNARLWLKNFLSCG